MAKAEATKRKSAPEATDGPLLDMNDATVKKFIKAAKARGFVTYDELNKVLPSDQNSSEQIEDIMSQLSEMGINVVDSEDDVEEGEREAEAGEDGEEGEEGASPARSKSTALATTTKDRYDRTDDPVRMYLREMGSVELLSREGEIAIAKRIEAGRDAMIRGLCESPLTFEAIMVWRQELTEERVLLRDIIDLEATTPPRMAASSTTRRSCCRAGPRRRHGADHGQEAGRSREEGKREAKPAPRPPARRGCG